MPLNSSAEGPRPTRLAVAIHREPANDRSHTHVAYLLTDDGQRVARSRIIDEVEHGVLWSAVVDGRMAEVRKVGQCTHVGCRIGPYIVTVEGDTPVDALDSLPEC